VCLALSLASGAARSAELCVACEAPAQTYRCSVQKSEVLKKYGLEEKAVLAACTKALAKVGPHERCHVIEASVEAPCTGVKKVLGLADVRQALSEESGGDSSTVVASLPERAGKAVKDASGSVGGAFKQAWTCVSSLFQDC
jgi:hypothetical protein